MDDRSAKLQAKANLFEGLASYTNAQTQRMSGAEQRAAGANLRDQFYMKSKELYMQAQAIASKPSGKRVDPLAAKERALNYMEKQQKVQQGEVATQVAVAKASSPGGEMTSADKERQTKIADKVNAARSVTADLDRLRGMVSSGAVGTWGISNPNFTFGDNDAALDANNTVKQIISNAARSFGAAVTDSDRKEAAAFNKLSSSLLNPNTWRDANLLDRIESLQRLAKAREERILHGHVPEDIARVNATTPKTKPAVDKDKLNKRLNTKPAKGE